jgi:prepilin peptidase CpaA
MRLPLEVALVCTVVVAGIFDLRYRRIPNWLNVSGIALGLLLNICLFSVHGLVLALCGFGCSLLIYVPLYLLRGMGPGDVKLMAAVGAIAGPLNWLCIFLLTALLGGAVSLIYVGLRRRLQQTFVNTSVLVTELIHVRLPAARESRLDVRNQEALRMPHGCVIALGAMAFLAVGPKLISSFF